MQLYKNYIGFLILNLRMCEKREGNRGERVIDRNKRRVRDRNKRRARDRNKRRGRDKNPLVKKAVKDKK